MGEMLPHIILGSVQKIKEARTFAFAAHLLALLFINLLTSLSWI